MNDTLSQPLVAYYIMESRDVQQKRENQPHNANLIKSHFFFILQEKESILEETFAASRRKGLL